ncbi:hypothetical protein [Cellulosimicrobium sp. Marseille-Q8652]
MDDRFRDWPRLGTNEVDPGALSAPGGRFSEVLADLGVDGATAPGAPDDGWRVLRIDTQGVTVVGAPSRPDRSRWRIASVSTAETDGRRDWAVHGTEVMLRPSKAELGRGLCLRWPDAVKDSPDLDRLAIDVVNTGQERWAPEDDHAFVAVGVVLPVTAAGAPDPPFGFGYVRGRHPAVPLDPGEYARLPLVVSSSPQDHEEPGPQHVVALLPELGLTTADPLSLTLTAEQVARRRRPPPQLPDAEMLRPRLAEATALLSARAALHQVVDAVLTAPSDDAAVARISDLLSCDPVIARRVYSAPLRRFRSQEHLMQNVVECRQDVEDAESRSAV